MSHTNFPRPQADHRFGLTQRLRILKPNYNLSCLDYVTGSLSRFKIFYLNLNTNKQIPCSIWRQRRRRTLPEWIDPNRTCPRYDFRFIFLCIQAAVKQQVSKKVQDWSRVSVLMVGADSVEAIAVPLQQTAMWLRCFAWRDFQPCNFLI